MDGLNLDQRPNYTQTNNGVGLSNSAKVIQGLSLSNHTIIQRTTTIKASQTQQVTFTNYPNDYV